MAAIYNMGRMLLIVAVCVYLSIYLAYKLGNGSKRKIKHLKDLIDKDLEAFKRTGRCNKNIKKISQKLKKRTHKLALFDYLVKKVAENQDHLMWIQESGVVAPHIKKSTRKEFNQLFKLQCIEQFGKFEDQVYIEPLGWQKSFYIKTSRLKALAAIGAGEALIESMNKLKIEEPTMDDKLLVEYLLHYKGDHITFNKILAMELVKQNEVLVPVILSYFTLKEEQMVADLVQDYLVKETSSNKLKVLSILYFEKVRYQPVEADLISYLTHENEELRMFSAKALKQYHDAKSMLALEKALEDCSYKVRESAAKSFYYRMSHHPEQALIKEEASNIERLVDAVIADETQLKHYMRAEETRKSDEDVERYRQFLLEKLS